MRPTSYALAAFALVCLAAPGTGSAQPSCGQLANPIPCENALPGNPASEWDVAGAGSATIQGFATDISVNRGDTVRFKVQTPSTNYRLDIYRMGWYGGQGARRVATVQPSAALPQSQPACLTSAATGLVDCGNWAESASWAVPADAVSGIYFARLVREDGPAGASHVVFIVRDDASDADLLFQTSDTTWQAYNSYGGNSLYVGAPDGRAYKVSYNRPFNTRAGSPEDWVFNAEYPMVRWLERNGYNVAYFTGVDSDRRGAQIRNHRVFLSVGHDEYWSAAQRAAVEAARDAGVHLAFFSGNEVFWKTRWEASIDGSGTTHRTLVCYKETENDAKIDPLPGVWTGTWRDPRFSPPADGGRPENALTGTLFMVNDGATTSILVPEADGKMRFWRNTTVATLGPGATATLPNGTLGYEWDADVDNGARPAGLVPLSRTTVNVPGLLLDFGSTYGPGVATHRLSFHRAPGGGLVFGAGTVQWAWGLDDDHDRGSAAPDPRMQQATVNLLADMGAQPATLQSGLVAATASTDSTPPTSAITSPAAGATVPVGSAVTITGTATDGGGGRIGAVEVSVDGGATWRPATGRETWSFTWTPTTAGSVTIRSSAVDDSANVQTATTAVTVTAGSGGGGGGGGGATCPCTLFPPTATPATPSEADPAAVEVGVKFTADVAGTVTAIRFYKGPLNTGTHVGHLWTATGTLLGTATFTGETASGWQQASFPTPIAIAAGTTYVASYFAPAGRYAVDDSFFTVALDRPPLHAPATGTTPNGVYRYGPSGFPDQTFAASNYWVDVVFATTGGGGGGGDTTPPTVTGTTPAAGATGVAVTANVTATFSEAMDPASISTATFELRTSANALVPATVTWSAGTLTATLDPSASLAAGATYTATVRGGATDPRARDVAGNPLGASATWSFTTAATGGDTTPPTVVATGPAAGATGVAVTANVTATFNEAMDPASISTATFELRDPASALVAAAVTWDAGTRTATLDPTASLAAGATYTATVRGGATDPRVRDVAGNPLATTVTWSFTTAGTGGGGPCPCTLFLPSATPATASAADTAAVELGVKFRSDLDGVVTAIRFYKGALNTGTHVGHVWTATGTLLGTVTFTGESGSGWQQATFPTPIPITANTTYVASYFAPVGRYAFNAGFFTTGTDRPPLHAPATTVTPNGVYRYGPSGFPDQTFNAANYWVDVVFNTSGGGGPDTTPPTVTTTSPPAGATGVSTASNVTATFSEAMDPASITTATFELRAGGTPVPAAVTYDPATRVATLNPADALTAATSYTATVRGGTTDPRVKDLAGNALAGNVTWSFTTASGPAPTGSGLILVVLPSSGGFGRFLPEILRTEGLNAFNTTTLPQVTPGVLSAHDVVVLAETPLTAAEVTMFTDWVNGGGNLIAMRPAAGLAGLLGLSAAGGGPLANAYLAIDTSGPPGSGLVSQTIQYHGPADRYTLNGATAVATLFSSATASTSNPAVTVREVGTQGGHAAAFTYDLARSVVYTRQGNPAWSGQERDGISPIRSDDLYFGAAAGDVQPDWVNLAAKVAIPQADEQQRLLANLVLFVNRERTPLPRFWYFPRGLRAAVVMTGDDHANNGTTGRFDAQIAQSPPGCSVDAWQCIRSTSYVFPDTPITDAQAAAYAAQGFEISVHINTACGDYTATSLAAIYEDQLSTWASAFPSLQPPATQRTHCIVWSDWATQARVELTHEIGLDTNYYYWPPDWVANRPGFFTGSGMPMRFADVDGTVIDVYQAATQMTDESSQSYPFTAEALLDGALGPSGYYGFFVANMHTDAPDSAGSDAIIAAARARNVPVITARQLLAWTDGRNGSTFSDLSWSGGVLTFTLGVGAGANGLQAMLPATSAAGTLDTLTRDGGAVSFTVQTIKGVSYAVFTAAPGAWEARYQ